MLSYPQKILLLMAEIQFSRGITETDVPQVGLTRAKRGNSGTAKFIFTNPTVFQEGNTQEVTGMYMLDEEGELMTREVKAKFVNGQPATIEVLYLMDSQAEWDRFMRFMERYAKEHGMGFTKSK